MKSKKKEMAHLYQSTTNTKLDAISLVNLMIYQACGAETGEDALLPDYDRLDSGVDAFFGWHGKGEQI